MPWAAGAELRTSHDGKGDKVAAELVVGIERAVFGPVTADDVTAWLDRHVTQRLSARVSTMLFRTGRVSAVYGLLRESCYTADSIHGSEAPAPDEARAFLIDYETARAERFSPGQQAAAAAAATWVMAYNARCQLSADATDVSGSPLATLSTHRHDYLSLRW